MAGSGREARRRRILEGGQDRLALITGRKPNLSSDTTSDPDSSPPFIPPNHHHDLKSRLHFNQPSASQDEDKSSLLTSSTQDQAAKYGQHDALLDRNEEEPFVRKPESATVATRAPPTEDSHKGESSSTAPKTLLTASDAALRLAQQIPIGNLSSQQVSIAVAETEHDRMLCALTVAILVVLSYAGFPVVSTTVFRWIILFRPLFLVLITNITLIVRRLLPDNQKNLSRGVKDHNSSLLGDGYAWAEEAGRALELGLMLQNVVSALFMDCSVYATIVVFGLSLFG